MSAFIRSSLFEAQRSGSRRPPISPAIPAFAPALLVVLGLLCYCSLTLHAGNDAIPNDKFADDGASWKLAVGRDVAAKMSVEKVDNEPALRVEVTVSGDATEANPEEPVNVRVRRPFGEITSGATYRISFQAKAERDAGIVSFISSEKEGARVFWRTGVALDSDWKEFTFSFDARDTGSDCVFGFTRFANTSNKYWFKDIVVTKD